MALQRLQYKPGINRDTTNYANEGGFYECDKVRFRSGYPQKIGGWESVPTVTINGTCRQLFNYVTSFNDNILWIGTNSNVYAEVGGNLQDLTPARAIFTTPDTDDCFDTTNGSNIVNVNIVNHGVNNPGESVTFSDVVGPIGGIPQAEFNATFSVVTVTDSNNFTIQVTTSATSTVTGGGGTAIVAVFPILPGPVIDQYGYGWSAGAWSRLGWGTGTLTPLIINQRDWWFDNFDNDTVMNIRNGTPYYWAYDATYATRAITLEDAADDAGFDGTEVPSTVMQLMVSQNDKHLLAFGATPYLGGQFDPLLIRWADQDNPFQWVPQVTNTAGFLRVSRGSRIVRALPTRQETLVFTDTHLYSLQFTGTTDVFSLQELADNLSIMSSRACATTNNVTYWMGFDKFYLYSGRVETLPCTLLEHVFENLNYEQQNQVVCGTNEQWQEIWWLYPSANATTNDSYVIYNYQEKIWYYGSLERTAWLDTPLRRYAQAVNGQYLYEQEKGVDADGAPMTSFITSSDFDITDGDQLMLVRRIIPDISFQRSTAANPQVLLTMKPRNFPGSNYSGANEPAVTLSTTVPVEQYTEQVFIRARARQMGFKIQSTDLGVHWQLGAPRLDGRPDGRR